MLRENADIGLTTGTVNPVVGECNDGFLSDLRGRHVHQEHVWQAIDTATSGAVAEGNVGAGTGTPVFSSRAASARLRAKRSTDALRSATLVQTNYGNRPEM